VMKPTHNEAAEGQRVANDMLEILVKNRGEIIGISIDVYMSHLEWFYTLVVT
jgi:alkyl hydroperoxide reductase subunit AhpC